MQKGPKEATTLVTVGSKFTRRLAAFPLLVIGAYSSPAIAWRRRH